jgi:hypothetical protein
MPASASSLPKARSITVPTAMIARPMIACGAATSASLSALPAGFSPLRM